MMAAMNCPSQVCGAMSPIAHGRQGDDGPVDAARDAGEPGLRRLDQVHERAEHDARAR